MTHLPASVRVYFCLTACDMRKSFDGLHAVAREYLKLDAFAGHLFVFEKFRNCYCVRSDRSSLMVVGTTPRSRVRPTFSSWTSTCHRDAEE